MNNRIVASAADAMDPDLLPTTFQSLRFAEQFTIWSVRKWVEQMRAMPRNVSSIRQAFDESDVGAAFSAFDHFMRLVVSGARRQIEVNCPSCRVVSSDEEALLALVAALQAEDKITAYILLGEWLHPAAVRLAYDPVQFVADVFDDAGISLYAQIRHESRPIAGQRVH